MKIQVVVIHTFYNDGKTYMELLTDKGPKYLENKELPISGKEPLKFRAEVEEVDGNFFILSAMPFNNYMTSEEVKKAMEDMEDFL